MKFIYFIILLLPAFSQAQIITTIAGNDTSSYTVNGGPAVTAELSAPIGVTVDKKGNIYVADQTSNMIRKITPEGIIITIAGTGDLDYTGDGGLATNATLSDPYAVAVDRIGNVYISDFFNNVIRKVDTLGIITTIAGYGGLIYAGYSGDGGLATNAQLNNPAGLAFDTLGNLYVTDYGNNRIRIIDTAGIINTFAGNGSPVYSGDGGAAVNAGIYAPQGVAVDDTGNVYIADVGDYRIRKVDVNGIITTIAGNGSGGFGGDGGPALSAMFNDPYAVAVDHIGNLYVADGVNQRIRKIAPSGIITTVAGSGNVGFSSGGYNGDGIAATDATLSLPYGVAVDTAGSLYIADLNNYRIRKVTNGIPNMIWGNVILSDSAVTDSTCRVWLIKYDSATATLSAIDSTTTCVVNNKSFYEFLNEPAGNYLLKASLIFAPDSGTGYLPTYHSSTFYWDTANYVNHIGGNDTMVNIILQYGISTGGPGFISGSISSGANKGTSGSVSVAGLFVLLRDSADNFIAYTRTNSAGMYSFSNIANGKYNVFPTAINYSTIPSSEITFNVSNETVYNVDFVQHTVAHTITPHNLSIENISKNDIVFYPNPVNDLLTVRANNKPISQIAILNTLGQIVYIDSNEFNNRTFSINCSEFAAGIYYLKINNTIIKRFVKL